METDFEMFAGDDKEIQVDVVDLDGNAVDLTDSVIFWAMYSSKWKKTSSPTPIVTKSTAVSGDIVFDSTVGRFFVMLNSADTDGLKGRYYHEAQVQLQNGAIGTCLTGVVTINRNAIVPF